MNCRIAKQLSAGRSRRAVLVAILAIHASLVGWQSVRDSPTWDEVGHFAAGLEHWQYGRFQFYRVNPPLVRLVATTFIYLGYSDQCNIDGYSAYAGPGGRPEFQVGRDIALRLGERYFALLSLARLTCIPFSILGGWICYRWAWDLWGGRSAVLALLLWCVCPSILGHGHLITPDVGATSTGLCASYAFWRWLRCPTIGWAVAAGMLLGVAQLTKLTWVVLLVLWPVLWTAYQLMQTVRQPVYGWSRQGTHIAVILLLSAWAINLGYGFEGSFRPLAEYRFVSQGMGGEGVLERVHGMALRNRFATSRLGAFRVPLPENYLSGIDVQKADFERRMWSYLRGEWRLGGWWYYYLYALLIKEPLGTWLLLVLAIGVTIFARGYSAPSRDELVLLAPALAVLVLVSSQTGFNHHLRYVLPALPFLFIWISKLARSIDLGHRPVAAVAGLCLLWSIGSSLWVYPHSLSYFNELAGGSKGGHYHLGNSNTDWGQDLLYLKRWLDKYPQASPLHLAYDLPLIDPKLVGIDWRPPPPGPQAESARQRSPRELGPLPGWHAVSVNRLHGRGREFEYFLEFQPVGMAGYSIYIYHITPDQANRVRARLGLPPAGHAGPATSQEARDGS